MKRCSKCGNTKPLDQFYADGRARDGKRSACKECHALSVLQWRRNNPDRVKAINGTDRRGRERIAAYNRSYRVRHQHEIAERQRKYRNADRSKDWARDLVRRAVKSGRILKPTTCEACGDNHNIEASHRDYSSPLVIQWLCVRCHRQLDMRARAALEPQS